MALLPSWAFLAVGAFHPRADFIAGKARCLAMCELGCQTDPNNPASSCVAISEPLIPPWVDTFNGADQETFKYKWCRLKYQIAVVAAESDDGFFQTIKFPSSDMVSGMFKEIDHLDWIAPTCDKTTAPSCRSVQATSTISLDVGFKLWFDHEGNDCRNLVDDMTCRMDCLRTCSKWCQCGWGRGAEVSYAAGKFRRQVYNATTNERTCRQVYVFDKMCLCSHGSPVNSAACLMHGKEQCASCDPGYKLHKKVCLRHECNCLNGTPVSSEACTEHNAKECSSCDRNYHLGGENGKKCEANQCTCDHGMPVSSVECMVHGATKCTESTCEPAFHFELNECKANACFCRHGSPMPSGQCVTHGEHVCARCNGGYHLDETHEKYCEPNVCQCRYGTAVASENCAAHLANHCQTCNTGFHLSRNEDKCQENVCKCDHGLPVGRQDCLVHGETKCRENSCNPRYHLESDDCTENVCKCDHGVPVARHDCLVHSETKCRENSCNRGYHLESDDCTENICKCDHGMPVARQDCLVHGETKCRENSCNSGYHLESDDCTVLVTDLGASGCTRDFPCKACHGDCDTDADCEGSLRCFQREEATNIVPGCGRNGYKRSRQPHDYCYDPLGSVTDLGGSGCTRDLRCKACHGDCDTHADCEGSLRCFQREEATDIVPGCGRNGYKQPAYPHDYCYDPLVLVTDFGTSGCTRDFPCKACEGDCDNHTDCEGSLRCFQREEATDLVPGCGRNGYKQSAYPHDYCYDPLGSVTDFGESGCTRDFPCKACEGDCDTHADCEGSLRCFQREEATDIVPGCGRNGYKQPAYPHDYCYDPLAF